MRKTVTFLLICCILFSLAGCAKPAHALTVPTYPKENQRIGRDLQAELYPYLSAALPALLGMESQDNLLCSPLNIYMALAMLAQVTAGESRAQVLSALGSSGIDELRARAGELWRASYRDEKQVKRILGSSLWLDRDLTYDRDTLNVLAEDYYASVYQGEMGSDSLNTAYRQWMNDHTGGLLQEQVSGMRLTEDLRCAIAATVYYKSAWSKGFVESRTKDEPFYGPEGETLVPMMHQTAFGNYYWGDRFSAVSKSLNEGEMWFILPDEGVTPGDLLEDVQALDFLINYRTLPADNHRHMKIHLTVPKYDVESKMDLRPVLKQLGISDALDPKLADFSALLPEDPAFVGAVTHGARVIVNEKEVEAAAYTEIQAPASAAPPENMEEIWFTADRPFLFVITGAQSLPLFIGIVQQP